MFLLFFLFNFSLLFSSTNFSVFHYFSEHLASSKCFVLILCLTSLCLSPSPTQQPLFTDGKWGWNTVLQFLIFTVFCTFFHSITPYIVKIVGLMKRVQSCYNLCICEYLPEIVGWGLSTSFCTCEYTSATGGSMLVAPKSLTKGECICHIVFCCICNFSQSFAFNTK